MSWAYRCMRCRGRNTLAHKFEWYKRTPTCRHCGHFRMYPDRERQYRKDICRDSSCCHYPHRIGSTVCIHHPQHEIIVRTGRGGELLSYVLEDIARRAAQVGV